MTGTAQVREYNRQWAGWWLVLVGIFGLALALRLAYIWEIRTEPDFNAPAMDALYHHQWALGLATGQWDENLAPLRNQPYFRAPLYVFFLSALYRILGIDLLAVRVVQALIGALSCVLICWLGVRAFGRREGALAGIMAATYWIFIYFDGELLLPVMEVFLDVLAIVLLVEADRREERWWLWLAAGLALGASAITRPNILLFFPLAFAWILATKSRRNLHSALRSLMPVLVGISLTILPVTVRNLVVGGDLVLISSQGGVNFFIGNNPRSDGVTAIIPGTRGTWWGGYYDAINIAEQAEGRKLKPSEVSEYWMRRGRQFIREQPGEYLRLMARKVILLAGNFEIPNNKDLNFHRRNSHILRWLPLDYGTVLSMALLGMVLSMAGLRNWKANQRAPRRDESVGQWREGNVSSRRAAALMALFIFSYAASIVLFFVTARYRVPLIPFLMIFAAHALRRMWEFVSLRCHRHMVVSFSALVVLMVLTHMDPFGMSTRGLAQAYYGRGVDFSLKGDHGSALEQFRLALKDKPDYPDALYNMGLSLMALGKFVEAEEAFRRTITLTPGAADAHLQLGLALLYQGHLRGALEALERSVELDPGNAVAHNLLGALLGRMGQYDRGIRELMRAIALDPRNAMAYYNLASLYAMQGRKEEALDWLEKALEKGYGPLDRVRNDPDLRSLHNEERFWRLLRPL